MTEAKKSHSVISMYGNQRHPNISPGTYLKDKKPTSTKIKDIGVYWQNYPEDVDVEWINAIRKAIRNKKKLPARAKDPITISPNNKYDGEPNLVRDGHHRYFARKFENQKRIKTIKIKKRDDIR